MIDYIIGDEIIREKIERLKIREEVDSDICRCMDKGKQKREERGDKEKAG